MNFGIEIICLDREFYAVDVFDFLQKQNIPHIVPVVKKGFNRENIPFTEEWDWNKTIEGMVGC